MNRLLLFSLLAKAKKGNDKAFLKLMDEEKVKLYKMAYIYTKNESAVLDVVQETVTKAYASIHTLKEEKYFSTWITKILINTALEMHRKSQKLVLLNGEIEKQAMSTQQDEKLDLLHALEQIDEKYKTVILLKYYRDLTVKDIAVILECPEGTVKTNLHRGLQQLRTYLSKGGGIYGEQY